MDTNPDTHKLQHIAHGGPMDIVDAIRLLSRQLIALQNNQPSADLVDRSNASDRHVFYNLFDDRAAKALLAAGYNDIESLRKANTDQLTAINGIGPATVRKILEVTG